MSIISNAILSSNILYTGPSSYNYAVAATGVQGKTADVLWKENAHYYVRVASLHVEGYIPVNLASLPSGFVQSDVDTFSPALNKPRYVSASATAYLGQGTSYDTISAPKRAQMVNYLGKKTNRLAYIEYSLVGNTRKYRAWYDEMSLAEKNASALTASQYLNRITETVSPYEPRFQPYYDQDGNRVTLCNHYAYYAMRACNTPLPARSSDGAPAVCEEMLTRLTNGFENWRLISMTNAYEEAQARANNGYPTIALDNGHVAVVRPNSDGSLPSSKGEVRISQAGSSIFDDGTLVQGWGNSYNAVQFFSWYY